MLKKPLNFKKQTLQLFNHGVNINDYCLAEEILNEVNYYRLTGYLIGIRKSKNDSDLKQKVDFDKLYSTYKMDNELKNFLFNILIKIELNLRTIIAYEYSMSKCIYPPHDQHYDKNNYYYKKGFYDALDSLERTKNYNKDSLVIKHHKEKYSSKMPLWVLVEFMSFSTLSKYYSSMYYNEQKLIANKLKINYKLLPNWLHCLSVLRNYCAHGARLYNIEFKPSVKLGRSFLKHNPDVKNNTLFSYIYIMFKMLPKSLNKSDELDKLYEIINNYPNVDLSKFGFTENYKDLLEK
ncbi:MAG: Abi family protein [Peptoniphilaceae bacterium]|nr:Abi family protein [Peptoniphilaceae bacterium]MDY6019521.1 Abi family protein [Anaerococcus sp.]